MAASRNTSAPDGWTHAESATAAVSVRRGSTTTIRPHALAWPRLAAESGTVHRLPFETIGFAPRISRKSLRSMSGTGIVSHREHQAGRELLRHLVERGCREEVARAERFPDPRPVEQQPILCATGLPTTIATASRPCCARIGSRRFSISANASSQLVSTNRPPRFTSGVRSRSGSSCKSFSAAPFGQT